jgi:hypothetical protein
MMNKSLTVTTIINAPYIMLKARDDIMRVITPVKR